MIELMAGPLIGANALKKDLYDNDGLFIIAIDPNAMGETTFYSEIEIALQEIKNSAPAPGAESISLPGERSAEKLAKTMSAGNIDVADATLQKIKDLAA